MRLTRREKKPAIPDYKTCLPQSLDWEVTAACTVAEEAVEALNGSLSDVKRYPAERQAGETEARELRIRCGPSERQVRRAGSIAP